MSNRIKSLKVRCQFCRRVNRTKNLEMELLCKICGKWAKHRFQKLVLRKVHDLSNHKYLQIHEVIPQDVVQEEIIA
ncbi:MAG: hypothetical protein KGI28_02275 [Thaumarchaeota archaeon]|nr:hypothetical protein [Nitrososphaerota archaeon]